MFTTITALTLLASFPSEEAERAYWIEQAGLVAPDQVQAQPHRASPQPNGRAFGLNETPSGLVAFGPGYSAVFHDDGPVLQVFDPDFELEPARFALEFESVTLGERVLSDRTPDGFTWQDLRVTYALGDGFDLVYDVREEGLELSLDVARRPEGDGALSIRARLVDQASGAPFDLTAEGRAGVSIGDVVAFDARGRSFEGTRKYTAGRLDFGVDRNTLDEAQFPLRIDPTVGPLMWQNLPHPIRQMDVTYDATYDTFGIVYQRQGDNLSVFQRFNGTTIEVGRVLAYSTASAGFVSICNVNEGNHFVVGVRENSTRIRMHCFGAAMGAGRTSQIVATVPASMTDFELGGEMLEPYTSCLLAYTDLTGGVMTRLVRADSAGILRFNGGIETHLFGTGAHLSLSVSQSGGPQGYWAVAVERDGTPLTMLMSISWTNRVTAGAGFFGFVRPKVTTDGLNVWMSVYDTSGRYLYVLEYQRGSGNFTGGSFHLVAAPASYSTSAPITQVGSVIYVTAQRAGTTRIWALSPALEAIGEYAFPALSSTRGMALASSTQSARYPAFTRGLMMAWSNVAREYLVKLYP